MTRDEIIEIFKRYNTNMDDLLKAEVENIYYSSCENERIEITKVSNDGRNKTYMPDEWARYTVKEGSRNEKIALARFASYPDQRFRNLSVDPFGKNKTKEKSLEDYLLETDDQLIICALYENQTFLSFIGSQQVDEFKKTNFIERLALVRNPEIDLEVIEKIYDLKNSEFGLSNEQRVRLITAFTQNDKHKFMSRCFDWNTHSPEKINDKYDKLWDLALTWMESPFNKLTPSVEIMTFKNIGCSINKMIDVYSKLRIATSSDEERKKESLFARQTIFEGIKSLKLDEGKIRLYGPLLKLGLSDDDGKGVDNDMFEYSIRGIASSLIGTDDRKNGKPNPKSKIIMSIFSYGWQVIVNLITLGVLLAVC